MAALSSSARKRPSPTCRSDICTILTARKYHRSYACATAGLEARLSAARRPADQGWSPPAHGAKATLQREWAYALEYASSAARRAPLPHWARHYNEPRTHSALGNRPPTERVREVTGLDT